MFFQGQPGLIRQLGIYLPYLAKNESIGMNFLLSGPSGWGKTRLGLLCCNFLCPDQNFGLYTPDKKTGDVKLEKDLRVHFIDESHTLTDYEYMYQIMDSGKYVFFFATNEAGGLLEPFVNRCVPLVFEPYPLEDLIDIVREHFPYDVSEDDLNEIVKAGCSNPRIIISLARRLTIYSKQNGLPADIKGVLRNTFGIVNGIDAIGQRYLDTLQELGGRASLDTISGVMHTNRGELLYRVEPILLHLKKIQISPKGRLLL